MACVCELRNDAMRVLYRRDAPNEVYLAGHRGFLEHTVCTHYGKLSVWLEKHGTLYLTCNAPASADFELWEMLDMHELWANHHMCRRPLKGFEALTALYENLRCLPQMQPYFCSKVFDMPYNNKMAGWSASESTWRGAAADRATVKH